MVTVVALPDSFLLVVVVVTVGMGAAARFTTANIPLAGRAALVQKR